MGALSGKRESLLTALDTLKKSIDSFKKIVAREEEKLSFMENKDLVDSLRDSMIQRFEYSYELFWKYLKKYLSEVEGHREASMGPRSVMRTACKFGIISPKDCELGLEMIDGRNMTSHIYKEEIADRLSAEIPKYYELMRKYAEELKKTS